MVEGVGATNKFFAGSLISDVVVVLVAGFGSVETTGTGVDKLGVAIVTGVGAGDGEGFF